MSRRERRSVSLGRHRDRGPRDPASRPMEDDLSTRHNISNFLLTLQRVQASEEENRQLRQENQLLRQRARSSRLSSASLRDAGPRQNSCDDDRTCIQPEPEDEVMAAETKRNSLIFVGDTLPFSPEHAALEAQHKRLQEDFDILKEFLKHLFQHALTMSAPDLSSCKETKDINTFEPAHSKQLERNLAEIHGQISQLRTSQDQQQVQMEQVHRALANVLSQSSVRNDVTMRLVRQQDKMKEMAGQVAYLEGQLRERCRALRQSEEKLQECGTVGQKMQHYLIKHNKNLKGTTREDLNRMTEEMSRLSRCPNTCSCKMAAVTRWLGHMTSASQRGETLAETRPPAEVVECMSRLERLVASDWHRLGRVLGLSAEGLEDIGKFTNFDLTSRVEKLLSVWARTARGASADGLRQALEKMDRDLLLVAEPPLSKQWQQIPSDVQTFCVAHLVEVQTLTHHMAGVGALGQDTKAFILAAPQEHRRAARLLHTCVYMGVSALTSLCTGLDRSTQTHVATKVRDCLTSSSPTVQRSESLSDTSEDVWTPRPASNHHQHNNSLNNTTPGSRDHLNVSHASSSSSSTSKSSTKSAPKERKKRSRSLFARKNKLRDTDLDLDPTFQEDLNYHYPAVNMNVHSQISSGQGESERKREERQMPRQYGRKNAQYSTASREGVVV